MKIPTNVQHCLDALEKAGHQAYVVGGCVRDTLLGSTPTDWDVATDAHPCAVRSLFARTADTGSAHGTITVIIAGAGIEVTTFRADGVYLDGRRPVDVRFSDSILEDLARRDFTMNAIAYSPAAGLVDPFGGARDISAGIIRAVGDPDARLSEDALRMLRAIRFSAQLGFCVDAAVTAAIEARASRISLVSSERIRAEMGKLLMGKKPAAITEPGFVCMLPHILGGAYDGNLAQTADWIAACAPCEPMRVALFLHWAGSAAAAMLRRLRYEKRLIRETAVYISRLHTDLPQSRAGIKTLLRDVGEESFFRLAQLQSIVKTHDAAKIRQICADAREIIGSGECYRMEHLAVDGFDIQNAGIAAGAQIGAVLRHLLDCAIKNPQNNNRETLLRLAQAGAGDCCAADFAHTLQLQEQEDSNP